jgi:hypothetical protein
LANAVFSDLENGILKDATPAVRDDGVEDESGGGELGRTLISRLAKEHVTALGDVCGKFLVHNRSEYDSFGGTLCDSAGRLMRSMVNRTISAGVGASAAAIPITPYLLVRALLLEPAKASVTLTARLTRMRNRVREIAKDILKCVDADWMTRFLAHVILRAPEKAHLRRSAIEVLLQLLEATMQWEPRHEGGARS